KLFRSSMLLGSRAAVRVSAAARVAWKAGATIITSAPTAANARAAASPAGPAPMTAASVLLLLMGTPIGRHSIAVDCLCPSSACKSTPTEYYALLIDFKQLTISRRHL